LPGKLKGEIRGTERQRFLDKLGMTTAAACPAVTPYDLREL
jgi:hypothetical protein